MKRLAPGVFRIPTSSGDRDNAFVVEADDGLTLVDVGWKKSASVIREALQSAGRQINDVRRIVITHAHPDHVRGLADMRAITGADVLIHHRDAPWLRAGRVPAAGRSGALGRAVDVLPLLHWTPVAPDIELTGGETIAGLRVIHTPGHSPGHIALLHEATQTLLVGDAVFNRNDKVAVGPDAFAADPATRTESLELLNLDVAAVGFAHGTPLTGAAVDQFAAYCEQSRAFTVEGQRGEPYSR